MTSNVEPISKYTATVAAVLNGEPAQLPGTFYATCPVCKSQSLSIFSVGPDRGDVRYICSRCNASNADIEARVTGQGWEEPAPLDVYDLPPWPEDAFPQIGGFVTSVTTSVEVPVEVAFMDTLAACAAAVQGKYVVEIKPGYTDLLQWQMTSCTDSADDYQMYQQPPW